MITVAAINRVAAGGISNSLAAQDMAKVTYEAILCCRMAAAMCIELRPGGTHHEQTFSSKEVHNIVANLVKGVDSACADAIDVGDGRTVRQYVDEHDAAQAAEEGEGVGDASA